MKTRENLAQQKNLMQNMPGVAAVFKINHQVQCLYYDETVSAIDCSIRRNLHALFKVDRCLDHLVAPEDRALFDREVLQKAPTGLPINVTLRYIKWGGDKADHLAWMHLSAVKIRDEEGSAIYYAIMTAPPRENMLYRSIVEDSLTADMVMDKAKGTILFTNQAFRSLLCQDETTVLSGKNITDVLSPEISKALFQQVKSLKTNSFHEKIIHTKDDKHLLSKAKIIVWTGIEACLFYMLDQTEIQRRNERLLEIMDIIPGGIGIYILKNGKLKQMYLNDGFFRLLGGSEREMTDGGRKSFGSIHPADKHFFKEALNKIKTGSKQLDITYRTKNAEGNYFWLRILGQVQDSKNEGQIVYCSYFDVDKQTKLQIDLDNDRTVLQMVMRTAKMSSWEFDIKTKTIYQTEVSQAQHGYGSEVHNVPESLIADGYIHPKSVSTYRRLFKRISKNERILQGDIYVRTWDQKGYWWERVIMTPVFDANGNHVRSLGVSIDITEQKAMESKYEQQMEIFNGANSANLITKGLYNVSQNTVEYYDDASVNSVDRSKISSYDSALQGNADLAAVSQEREHFLTIFNRQHLLEQFKSGVTEVTTEYQRIAADGHIFWAQTTGKLYYDPVSGDAKCFIYSYDIDEQKTAQEMISTVARLEYDYLALLDCQTEEYQTYANKTNPLATLPNFHSSNYKQEVADYAREFLVPEDVEQNIHDMSIANIRKQLSHQEFFISYASVRNKDGSISKKKLKFSYMDKNREKVLITSMDVTDIYEREQEQLKKIREANNAKTEFLSHMSHDIRTPMNAIIGLSELAQDDVGNAQAMKTYVSNIRYAGKFLLGLVTDCLDFEKLAAHKMTLHNVPYPYQEFRSSILLMIEPLCRKKNIAFSFSEAAPYTVCIDKVRFEQIFFNLLSNSVKYTQEGGKIDFVAVSKLSDDKKFVICDFYVRDNGIGMSEEFQKRLFEPFEQESANATSTQQGTGLGLSIVKELVQLMGGTIQVKSQQGVGTEVKVHLDMENIENDADIIKGVQVSVAQGEMAGKKVLLLEDQDLNMVIAKKLLEKQKMVVYSATNGKLGLEQFQKAPIDFFDVIITDVRMPVMNGIEMAKTIRAMSRADAKTVPIIAMTANVFEDDVQETQKAGMNGHLSKPIDPELMYKEIVKVLQK